MDVYGYTPYQYNESDELAKQMFAQQALASSAFARPEPASHSLPAPTGLPWSAHGLPWGMQSPPQLVHFTANTFKDGKFSPVVHCKRKSMDMEPPIPAKQLITEEKMAAHLSGLHISSSYTEHALAQDTASMEMETPPAASPAFSERLQGRTIVLSEEIKKIQEEDIIPPALLERASRCVQATQLLAPLQPRLEKPQMSLVVWKPRDVLLGEIKEQDDSQEDKHDKRRGVLVTDDTNITDVEM